MKKILIVVLTVVTLSLCLTGCEPKKTGGGGQQQSYDRNSGQYK